MGCAASKTAAQSAVDVLPPAGQSAAVTAAPTDRRVPPTLAQPTSTQPTSTSPLSLARRPLAEAVQAATPPPQTISIGANVPRTDKPTVVFLFGVDVFCLCRPFVALCPVHLPPSLPNPPPLLHFLLNQLSLYPPPPFPLQGDPGSGKGQLIDLLAGEFDFRLVALEQLLMQRARLLSADSTATDDAAPVTRQSKMRRYSILGALKTIGSHDELNMVCILRSSLAFSLSSPSALLSLTPPGARPPKSHPSNIPHLGGNFGFESQGAALQLVKTAIEEAREQTDARHFVVDVIPNHRLVLNESPLLRNAAQTLIRFERLVSSHASSVVTVGGAWADFTSALLSPTLQDIKGHLDMSSFGLWLCAPADKPQTTLMPRSSKGQSPGDEPAPAKRLKGSLLLRSSIAPFVRSGPVRNFAVSSRAMLFPITQTHLVISFPPP